MHVPAPRNNKENKCLLVFLGATACWEDGGTSSSECWESVKLSDRSTDPFHISALQINIHRVSLQTPQASEHFHSFQAECPAAFPAGVAPAAAPMLEIRPHKHNGAF